MKRNLSVLTDEDIEDMKRWVRRSPGACPHIGCQKCKALFPNLPARIGGSGNACWRCPCNAFSVEYVTEVVNGILWLHDTAGVT